MTRLLKLAAIAAGSLVVLGFAGVFGASAYYLPGARWGLRKLPRDELQLLGAMRTVLPTAP